MEQDDLESGNQESSRGEKSRVSQGPRDLGFWREMWYQIKMVWYLLRDPEVPIYLKILPLAALIYILIPTDFIPDVFPLVGQLDDLTALIVGGKVFIELAPQRVVAQYLEAMRSGSQPAPLVETAEQDVIEGVIVDSSIIEGEFEEIDHNNEDQAV